MRIYWKYEILEKRGNHVKLPKKIIANFKMVRNTQRMNGEKFMKRIKRTEAKKLLG